MKCLTSVVIILVVFPTIVVSLDYGETIPTQNNLLRNALFISHARFERSSAVNPTKLPLDEMGQMNGRQPQTATKISWFHVETDIRYRYARTHVNSRIINGERNSSELVFQMVIPEAAYISKFAMEIDGKLYNAYVKEKEDAKNIYAQAQQKGQSAGLIEVNARHANIFTVKVNIGAQSKITFFLTYDEFLLRKFGRYEYNLNIHPEQVTKVQDFHVQVKIEESQNLTLVKVPRVRGNTEVVIEQDDENREARIDRSSGNTAVVFWSPSTKNPVWGADLARFLVHYDIQQQSDLGEILLMNGYFVHFFTPRNVLPLRKHVVYVLDTSGSMSGRKMEQLKQVMGTVMDDLKPDDYFNIIHFSTVAKTWKADHASLHVNPLIADEYTLRQAHSFIKSLPASGGTNIDGALLNALSITSRSAPGPGKQEGINGTLPDNVESLVLFLTDGEATSGVTKLENILSNVKQRNEARVPIYTIAFGGGAEFEFLKILALQNRGFGRKIYEGADADIQIRDFYKEISSPLLSNITFKYTANMSNARISKVTKRTFANIFDGAEIAVTGQMKFIQNPVPGENLDADGLNQTLLTRTGGLVVDIDANGRDGRVQFRDSGLVHNLNPQSIQNQSNSISVAKLEDEFLERLWAFITIKQLLEIHPEQNETELEEEIYVYDEDLENNIDIEDANEPHLLPMPTISSANRSIEAGKDRALRLALKYGFVTPLTSLVVVKPNVTAVELEEVIELKEAKYTDISDSKTVSSSSRGRHHGSLPVLYGGNAKMSYRPTSSLQVPAPVTARNVLAGAILMPSHSVANAAQILKPGKTNMRNNARSSQMRISPDLPLLRRSSFSAQAARLDEQLARRNIQLTDSNSSVPDRTVLLSKLKWALESAQVVGNASGMLYDQYVTVGGRKYIMTETPEILRYKPMECTGGHRHSRFTGVCKHFAECITKEIIESKETYVNNFFCTITHTTKSAETQFAGICCTK